MEGKEELRESKNRGKGRKGKMLNIESRGGTIL